MQSTILTRFALLGLLSLLAACGSRRRSPTIIVDPEPVPVSIEVEVYDPVTNFVWQDVAVRVLESEQEWSGVVTPTPYTDFWQFSDIDGLVFFDEYWIGDSDVGFIEDTNGAALLLPNRFEDEAIVVLELDGLGFTPLYVEVDLSWDFPDIFVSVPFD